jgi:hypothetical protein
MDEFTSVIHAANEEAVKTGTGMMGAAQLMLGILMQPDAEATIILRDHGITEENYRAFFSSMSAGARPPPPMVALGASTQAIRILPLAQRVLDAVSDEPDPKKRVTKLARRLLTDKTIAEGIIVYLYAHDRPGSRRSDIQSDIQRVVDALGDP